MQDQLDLCTAANVDGGSHGSVTDLARSAAKILAIVWFTGASVTWAVCPSPAPLHTAQTAKYADEVGYFIECLSLWPAIAYITLHHRAA